MVPSQMGVLCPNPVVRTSLGDRVAAAQMTPPAPGEPKSARERAGSPAMAARALQASLDSITPNCSPLSSHASLKPSPLRGVRPEGISSHPTHSYVDRPLFSYRSAAKENQGALLPRGASLTSPLGRSLSNVEGLSTGDVPFGGMEQRLTMLSNAVSSCVKLCKAVETNLERKVADTVSSLRSELTEKLSSELSKKLYERTDALITSPKDKISQDVVSPPRPHAFSSPTRIAEQVLEHAKSQQCMEQVDTQYSSLLSTLQELLNRLDAGNGIENGAITNGSELGRMHETVVESVGLNQRFCLELQRQRQQRNQDYLDLSARIASLEQINNGFFQEDPCCSNGDLTPKLAPPVCSELGKQPDLDGAVARLEELSQSLEKDEMDTNEAPDRPQSTTPLPQSLRSSGCNTPLVNGVG